MENDIKCWMTVGMYALVPAKMFRQRNGGGEWTQLGATDAMRYLRSWFSWLRGTTESYKVGALRQLHPSSLSNTLLLLLLVLLLLLLLLLLSSWWVFGYPGMTTPVGGTPKEAGPFHGATLLLIGTSWSRRRMSVRKQSRNPWGEADESLPALKWLWQAALMLVPCWWFHAGSPVHRAQLHMLHTFENDTTTFMQGTTVATLVTNEPLIQGSRQVS